MQTDLSFDVLFGVFGADWLAFGWSGFGIGACPYSTNRLIRLLGFGLRAHPLFEPNGMGLPLLDTDERSAKKG